MVEIHNQQASAVISLQGAQVLSWIPKGEAEVIWLSADASFAGPGLARMRRMRLFQRTVLPALYFGLRFGRRSSGSAPYVRFRTDGLGHTSYSSGRVWRTSSL